MEQKKIFLWSRWVTLIIAIIFLIYTFMINIGAVFFLGIGFAISFACADKCMDWAVKIKKDVNIAYLVGFLFGLVGLLGYWLYYKENK